MQNLRLWIAKHKKLAVFLLGGGLCAVYTWAFVMLSLLPVLIVILDIFIFLVNLAYVGMISSTLIKKPLTDLVNRCDPYPLWEMTSFLRTCKLNALQTDINLVNYCIALRETGEYQEALTILPSLNLDTRHKLTVIGKLAYQNNLADLYTVVGDFDKANEHYRAMLQYADEVKVPKQRMPFETMLLDARAQHHFRCGEYDEMLQTLAAMQSRPDYGPVGKVNDDLMCAKAYIRMGDTERAREKLFSVITRGNKLYAVTEAHLLLPTLNAELQEAPAE